MTCSLLRPGEQPQHGGGGQVPLANSGLAHLQQQKYESVILWVFEANLRARKFYEKHGFTLTGQKKLERSAPEVMYMKSL